MRYWECENEGYGERDCDGEGHGVRGLGIDVRLETRGWKQGRWGMCKCKG